MAHILIPSSRGQQVREAGSSVNKERWYVPHPVFSGVSEHFHVDGMDGLQSAKRRLGLGVKPSARTISEIRQCSVPLACELIIGCCD